MKFPEYWDDYPEFDTSGITPRRLIASDQCQLSTFELGHKNADVVVVVNPIRTPFLLMLPLVSALAKDFRIITWETRGSPFLDRQPGRYSVGVDRHAADLLEVVRSYDVNSFQVLAWCTGVTITTWAHANLALPITAMSCIGPDRAGRPEAVSQVQAKGLPLIDKINDKVALGEDVEELCLTIQRLAADAHDRDGTDPLLRALMLLNFRSPESIKQYARLIGEYFGSTEVCLGEEPDAYELFVRMQKSVPMTLFHCVDDAIIDYKVSVAAAARGYDTKVVLYPRGGHFAPFVKSSLLYPDVRTALSAAAHQRTTATIEQLTESSASSEHCSVAPIEPYSPTNSTT